MTSIDTTRERLAGIVGNTKFDTATQIADVILAEFVVIPRSELPEVVVDELVLQVGGIRLSGLSSAEARRKEASMYLAAAEHLDRQEAERATVEAERNARRDEIATEVADKVYGPAPFPTTYAGCDGLLRAYIDRIIELEEAAA